MVLCRFLEGRGRTWDLLICLVRERFEKEIEITEGEKEIFSRALREVEIEIGEGDNQENQEVKERQEQRLKRRNQSCRQIETEIQKQREELERRYLSHNHSLI